MAAAAFRLRCKSRKGQSPLANLTQNSTVEELVTALEAAVGQPAQQFSAVLVGYPPQPLSLVDRSILLRDTSLRSGDTLIVQEKGENVVGRSSGPPDIVAAPAAMESSAVTSTSVEATSLRVESVPPNNSCLFTSIALCLNDGKLNLAAAAPLRDLVAEAMLSDQVTYNEAVLGRSPEEYATWIRREDSWGGGVELAVLAAALGLEITVLDTISRVDAEGVQRFGEESGALQRLLLLYDGSHYDPLVRGFGAHIRAVFQVSDEPALQEARQLALVVKKQRGTLALLECQICGCALKGPQEAAMHTTKTRHDKFTAKA